MTAGDRKRRTYGNIWVESSIMAIMPPGHRPKLLRRYDFYGHSLRRPRSERRPRRDPRRGVNPASLLTSLESDIERRHSERRGRPSTIWSANQGPSISPFAQFQSGTAARRPSRSLSTQGEDDDETSRATARAHSPTGTSFADRIASRPKPADRNSVSICAISGALRVGLDVASHLRTKASIKRPTTSYRRRRCSC